MREPGCTPAYRGGDNKLTGYYRPEDIDLDLKALARGNVRFCGVNTGNESENRNWARWCASPTGR